MKRDETGGMIRSEKVCDVITRMIDAIETAGCTFEEEAVAVSVLSEWIENRVPANERFPIAQARHHFMQLFPGIA